LLKLNCTDFAMNFLVLVPYRNRVQIRRGKNYQTVNFLGPIEETGIVAVCNYLNIHAMVRRTNFFTVFLDFHLFSSFFH
jgi:hypothetical protein